MWVDWPGPWTAAAAWLKGRRRTLAPHTALLLCHPNPRPHLGTLPGRIQDLASLQSQQVEHGDSDLALAAALRYRQQAAGRADGKGGNAPVGAACHKALCLGVRLV